MTTSDFTTYCVYRIVCFQTGKVYVGQTNDFNCRERHHFNALRNGKHHNSYLQKAYNKYGSGAFYCETLERGIPKAEINTKEKYWIAHFDSFYNGYNATPGGAIGDSFGIPCRWNGLEYPTISDAARANGIKIATLRQRLRSGWTCDADEKKRFDHMDKSCVWNNIKYKSIKSAALACDILPSTMSNRLKNGYTCDSDMPPAPKRKECIWNNITYASISDAARAVGVRQKIMWHRINMGYKCDTDVVRTEKRQGCEWNGKSYKTIAEAAQSVGVAMGTMWERLEMGYTCDADMKRGTYKKHS